MSEIEKLHAIGQSIWFDYIERTMVHNGELAKLAATGVRGVTSNPTIFQQAIAKSSAYQADLLKLAAEGLNNKAIFETLAIADIQAATGVMFPIYESAAGHDGFVSLEVAPDLAHDTEATIAEGRRLHAAVNRANLMIKVPATMAGIPAIRQLLADGININVTLIFSLERYALVKEAFLAGLEDRVVADLPIDRIASVASFFVSRVDSNIDARLEKAAAADPDGAAALRALQGKAAVANAKLAYRQYEEFFAGPRWAKLAAQGAQPQRPLWASTSSKNPNYSDLIYVEPLIGPNTVNTMPPQTLTAFLDHGHAADTVRDGLDEALAALAALAAAGIDLKAVTDELEADGVKKFADSFVQLLGAIEERRKEVV